MALSRAQPLGDHRPHLPRPAAGAAAPGLLATELALLVVAAAGGWLPQKLRANVEILRALPRLRRERRLIQAAARIDAAAFAAAACPRSRQRLPRRGIPLAPCGRSSRYWSLVRACSEPPPQMRRPGGLRSRRGLQHERSELPRRGRCPAGPAAALRRPPAPPRARAPARSPRRRSTPGGSASPRGPPRARPRGRRGCARG